MQLSIYDNYNIFESYRADNSIFNKYKFTTPSTSTVYCTVFS